MFLNVHIFLVTKSLNSKYSLIMNMWGRGLSNQIIKHSKYDYTSV